MHQAKANERRAHPRAGPFDGAWSGGAKGMGLRITDLSEGGCFVVSRAIPLHGDRVVVKLALPQEGDVYVDGQVVTVDPGIGFAVRFIELATDQRTKIQQAVQRHCQVDASSRF